MPWYAPWSDLIKKKVIRYLLQRYLGQFLEEKLRLEQLNVDLYNGKGTVVNVALYSKALNELCESQGWGIEVTGGRIGSITVIIPWNALMSEDSYIEVSELSMTIRPRPRQTDGTSMLESMWSSVSSSIQLAQECLEKEGSATDFNAANAQTAAIDGLEKFAQTIDNVLNRIKAKFINTTIRLEYLPPKGERGIALIIKVKEVNYKNEAGGDPPDAATTPTNEEDDTDPEGQKTHFISSYATHHIKLEGITFYTEEFRIKKPNQSSNQENFNSSAQFYSTISNLPETEQFLASRNRGHADSDEDDSDSGTESQMPENNSSVYKSTAIQFCSWEGTQEIRLKMKQSEAILGPKASLELSFGAMNLFLTPRQIHLIVGFCDVFSNGGHRQEMKLDKTLRSSKRNREIKRSNSQGGGSCSSMSGAVVNHGCWSFPDDEAKQQSYQPQQQKQQKQSTGYRESIRSFDISESLDSSMTSSGSTTNSSKIRKRGTNVTINGDISRYSLRMTAITIFILHEDVLVECSVGTESPLSEESVSNLSLLSTNFFANKNKEKSSLRGICSKNHLKIHFSPIIMEGEEQRDNSMQLSKFTVSMARADLLEVLEDTETPILNFARPFFVDPGHPRRPEIALQIKHITPTVRRTGSKRRTVAKTDLVLSLESAVVEFDISLYDRLSSLMSPSPFTFTSKTDYGNNSASKSADSSSNVEINVESPSLHIRLRFPINDSRPLHDPNRVPWWKKNIRDDFLLFSLTQFRLKYTLPSVIDLTANEIDIFYCENDNASSKIHIGKTSLIEKKGLRVTDSSVDYPRLKIEFPSEKTLRSIAKHMVEDSSDSGETSGDSYGGTIYAKSSHERSPFSSKRICRESDTPHTKESSGDPETLLLPGDSEEMKRFRESAMQTSRTQVQLHFPVASVQVTSKHLFEILYNRLNTDLLMWQSVAPKCSPEEPQSLSNLTHSFMNAGMMDSIYIPSTHNDSEAESELSASADEGPETDDDSDTMYYSTYDRKRTSKRSLSSTSTATNACSFELTVGQGLVTLLVPVRGSDNNVIPGQMGEFVATVNDLMLFSVSGYQENPNLSYVCLNGRDAELRHCGLIPDPKCDPPLRPFGQKLPHYLQETLYAAPRDLTLRQGRGSIDREMLSLAIQINAVPDIRIKRLRVTVGLQNTTLRHNPSLSQHSWLNQIIDMFDILDYPIEGYIPYGVVTEMQLHLSDCSIDYRPLYFPYRAVLDLGSVMISSNLTTCIPGCTLRFVAEECALCLAPYDPEQNSGEITPEFLVSVVDLGLLEISLRINDRATESYPKLDLRASIQGVHVRACADSGQALSQLIAYFAGDCDIITSNSEVDESEHFPGRDDDDELLPMRKSSSTVPEVSPKQQERVNSLMADAMQEDEKTDTESEEDENRYNTAGVEVFFFPDETQLNKEKEEREAREKAMQSKGATRPKKMLPSRDQLSKSLHVRRESESSDEMRDILNFESSIMATSYMLEDEAVEAVPQVTQELGEVKLPAPSSSTASPAPRFSKKKSSDTDEDYCIIADEEKAFMANCGVQNLGLTQEPIRIVDNHFSLPIGKPDLLQAPPDFPMAVSRYTLCEMTLTWHLYGGHDFPKKDEDQSDKGKPSDQKKTSEMSNAYKLGVSYTKGQPGIEFGRKSKSKRSWKTMGGEARNHDVLLQIHINKLRLSHEKYPSHTIQASRQVLIITELEVRDKLKSSDFNKFLYHPSARNLPKKSSQHMVVIKALHVRPDPVLPAQECCLRVSLLPLRLNIDQDTLLFLAEYFTELNANDGQPTTHATAAPHQPPVMMVDDIPEAVQDLHARKMVSENLMLLMEGEHKTKAPPEVVVEQTNDAPTYFREVIFSPEVVIRLDYQGRRVELSRGPIAGLLMGLGQLNCSEIRLKKIVFRKGILGMDKMLNFLCKEWLTDIKKNQLPSILSGVGPMNSLVQLFVGIRDLFLMPIEQYQKDGRFLRGLQMGAQSFTASTALAALEITSRVLYLLQLTAETAFDMVSPGPSVKKSRQNRKGKRKRVLRPQDIREGVANAYQIVKDGIGETAQNLVDVTMEEHDQKGYSGAIGAVVRQIPPMVVQPVVLAAQASNHVINGVRNQLVPDARMEALEKYKNDDQ